MIIWNRLTFYYHKVVDIKLNFLIEFLWIQNHKLKIKEFSVKIKKMKLNNSNYVGIDVKSLWWPMRILMVIFISLIDKSQQLFKKSASLHITRSVSYIITFSYINYVKLSQRRDNYWKEKIEEQNIDFILILRYCTHFTSFIILAKYFKIFQKIWVIFSLFYYIYYIMVL